MFVERGGGVPMDAGAGEADEDLRIQCQRGILSCLAISSKLTPNFGLACTKNVSDTISPDKPPTQPIKTYPLRTRRPTVAARTISLLFLQVQQLYRKKQEVISASPNLEVHLARPPRIRPGVVSFFVQHSIPVHEPFSDSPGPPPTFCLTWLRLRAVRVLAM